MILHHLRHATFIIEQEDNYILVDPMLSKKGALMPASLFRFKARMNPLVDLPTNSNALLEKVTHCLITHLHPDHLDKEAVKFLKQRNTPVVCSSKDEKKLRKQGLNVSQTLTEWGEASFLGGKIVGVPARHGYGFIAGPMGNVLGFYLELPGEKSIYISADTVYTDDVERALTTLKPDIAILACGTAQLDFGQPLLMTLEDISRFIQTAPGSVVANHMEAYNHCPTTRKQVKAEAGRVGKTVFIPQDGESITFEACTKTQAT